MVTWTMVPGSSQGSQLTLLSLIHISILQMNLLDHDFYVFRNSDDDSISIVYHRKNGGYGLIVTDEEE